MYEEDKLIERAHEMGVVMKQICWPISRARHPSVGAVRIDRAVRHRRARAQPQDAGADGAVQRHVAGDAGAREVLPERRALYLRAVEHVLHESAAVHHRSRAARGVSRSSIAGFTRSIVPLSSILAQTPLRGIVIELKLERR